MGANMINGNTSDIGLWKCGRGRTFTHIPTNVMIFIELNSYINHKGNKREEVFDKKSLK